MGSLSTSSRLSVGVTLQCAATSPPLCLNVLTFGFVDHGISGNILCVIDHEGLKDVGVQSVGQRLTILREVYYLKVAHGVPIEPEHYVPPCE